MPKKVTKAISKKAVVLLSGGLDSTTTLAIALKEGYEVHALTFAYGQRHAIELEYAKTIAKHYGVKDHRIAEIDLRLFGGSALTDDAIAVPKDRIDGKNPLPRLRGRVREGVGQNILSDSHPPPNLPPQARGGITGDGDTRDNIPTTYVPARNTIFLSFALAFAENIGAFDIFIGVNALDYSGYPDCRPEYIQAFESLANLATAAAVKRMGAYKIHTPLISLSKAQIILKGQALGVDYALTLSCYDPGPDGETCGHCDACILRRKGFTEAGVADPASCSK